MAQQNYANQRQQQPQAPPPAHPPAQAAAPIPAQPHQAQPAQAVTFNEAPASINLKFDYRGANIQLTLRDTSGSALLAKIDPVLDHLEKMGATFTSPAGGARTVAAPGTPNCPDGHGPMRESSKKPGSYYCPAAVGTHPQTGKKLYCTHKVDN
jgi:hypothetical protein